MELLPTIIDRGPSNFTNVEKIRTEGYHSFSKSFFSLKMRKKCISQFSDSITFENCILQIEKKM